MLHGGSIRRVVEHATLLGLMAVSASRSACAEAASTPWAMTLPEALDYAKVHHPNLLAARSRVQAAAASAEIPHARWLPTAALGLELLAGTTNNSTASYLPLPGVGLPRIGATPVATPPSWRPEPSSLAAVGLSQQLFDFGRTAALSALADTAVDTARFDAQSMGLEVRLSVAQSYFAVRAAHEIVRASEQAVERALVHRDEARAKVNAGLRSPNDLTRAEADLARYSVGYTRAEGGLGVARQAFAAAVGAANGSLDARGEPPDLPPLPPVQAVLALALERQPELKSGLSRVEAARAETRAVRTGFAPDLRVGASVSARAGGADPSAGPSAHFGGFVPETPNWDVAVVLSWPFLDGVRSAQARAAKARESVALAELGSVKSELIARVHQAHAAAALAETSLAALEHAQEAAQANYLQAEARFHGGIATTVELADAEALRTQTEIELAIGHFDVFRARVLLTELTGASS